MALFDPRFPIIIGLSLPFIDRISLLRLQCANSHVASVVTPLIWHDLSIQTVPSKDSDKSKHSQSLENLYMSVQHPTHHCKELFCTRKYADYIRCLDLDLVAGSDLGENVFEIISEMFSSCWNRLKHFKLAISLDYFYSLRFHTFMPFSNSHMILQSIAISILPGDDTTIKSLEKPRKSIGNLLKRIFHYEISCLRSLSLTNCYITNDIATVIAESTRKSPLQTILFRSDPWNYKSNNLLAKIVNIHKDTIKNLSLLVNGTILDGISLDFIENLELYLILPIKSLRYNFSSIRTIKFIIEKPDFPLESLTRLMEEYLINYTATRFRKIVVKSQDCGYVLPMILTVKHSSLQYASFDKVFEESFDLLPLVHYSSPHINYLRVSDSSFEALSTKLPDCNGICRVEFISKDNKMHLITATEYKRYFPQSYYGVTSLEISKCVVATHFASIITEMFPNLKVITLKQLSYWRYEDTDDRTEFCTCYSDFLDALRIGDAPYGSRMKNLEKIMIFQEDEKWSPVTEFVLAGFRYPVKVIVYGTAPKT